MTSNRRYEPLKESREWYFLEYRPPIGDDKFATLNLVITEFATNARIIAAMEKELDIWLGKFPIPLFMSAFGRDDTLCDLSEYKGCSHLMGFYDKNHVVQKYWKLLQDNEIPDDALNHEYVDKLYANLVFKTHDELRAESQKKRQTLKLGRIILLCWLVMIPAAFAVLEYCSELLGFIVMVYSLYKATRKGLEITGKWPKSEREKLKESEERLKSIYYYHCQLNPEAFNRLKMENYRKLTIDDIQNEARHLSSKAK